MKSTAVWGSEEVELMNTNPRAERGAEIGQNGDEEAAPRNKLKTLKQLTFRLLREVQSISEVQPLNLEGGFDFYDEVSRFEIDLIKRALLHTAGHQGRAARLLNLKVTTLNSKIKHYNISLDGFTNGYPLVDAAEIETRPHA